MFEIYHILHDSESKLLDKIIQYDHFHCVLAFFLKKKRINLTEPSPQKLAKIKIREHSRFHINTDALLTSRSNPTVYQSAPWISFLDNPIAYSDGILAYAAGSYAVHRPRTSTPSFQGRFAETLAEHHHKRFSTSSDQNGL